MSSDDPTRRYRRFAAMVLVGDQADTVELCRRCAEELQVLCKYCQLDDAASTATRWRPFALLADETTCQDAKPELEKVAQVVGAELIILTNTMTRDREGSLMPVLRGARERLRA